MPVPPPGSPPQPYAPVAPSVPEAPPVHGAAYDSPEDRPALFEERWPAIEPEEETPTAESQLSVTDLPAAVTGTAPASADRGPLEMPAPEVTAETGPAPELPLDDQAEDAEPPRGFFFGRRMDDLDDTFAGEDGVRKDRTRDFEW